MTLVRGARETLPPRRRSLSFEFTFEYEAGKPFVYHAAVGFYEDGRPGEVFVNHRKHATSLDALARDLGIVLSVAMQFGVPLGVLKHSVGRDQTGYPASPVGMILDRIVEHTL